MHRSMDPTYPASLAKLRRAGKELDEELYFLLTYMILNCTLQPIQLNTENYNVNC